MKHLLVSRLTLFRSSSLLWFAICNHCISACFLSDNIVNILPARSFIQSLISSQVLCMSSLSFNSSKAGNWFEILIRYFSLNSNSLSLLRFNPFTSNLCVVHLFITDEFSLTFFNHQVVISITASFPERSYIEYT